MPKKPLKTKTKLTKTLLTLILIHTTKNSTSKNTLNKPQKIPGCKLYYSKASLYTGCKNCSNPFYLSSPNTNNFTCSKCNPSCSSCISKTNCTSCIEGHLLNPKKDICEKCTIGNCKKCSYRPLTVQSATLPFTSTLLGV